MTSPLPPRSLAQADIYSFGVLLWTMWCGDEPFLDVQGNLLALMMAITQGRRPSFDPALHWPQPVKDLLVACWAQEPSERPSFEELQEGGMLGRDILFSSEPMPISGDVAAAPPLLTDSNPQHTFGSLQ